jgi:hypothetical protein
MPTPVVDFDEAIDAKEYDEIAATCANLELQQLVECVAVLAKTARAQGKQAGIPMRDGRMNVLRSNQAAVSELLTRLAPVEYGKVLKEMSSEEDDKTS